MQEVALILLGLLLGIPFSIGANLMTPRWQAFWSKRSERARAKNRKKSAEFDRAVAWFAAHPVEFNTYLLRRLLFALMPAGFMILISIPTVFAFLAPIARPEDRYKGFVMGMGGILIVLSLLLQLFGIVTSGIRFAHAVGEVSKWPPPLGGPPSSQRKDDNPKVQPEGPTKLNDLFSLPPAVGEDANR